MTPTAAEWAALAGDVLLPGSPDYELASEPAIARFHDVRPLAVVRCSTADEVAETIALARRHGLRTAPRSGGHCFAGRSSTEGIVVDVTPMRSVSVTAEVATIGAGARLAEVYAALDAYGRTIPAGCGPTVGIAGLTLGGGLGILGRTYGLTADSLLGARVVLADGRVVDCDDHHEPDLFWALRGAGGGNFGVVTSLTFRTVPAPSATTFHLTWPDDRAATLIEAWQGWSPGAPDRLAASLLVTVGGEAGRRPVVNVFGAMLGSESDLTELLGRLVTRVGADPASAATRSMTYLEAKRYLTDLGARMTAHTPVDGHMYSKSEFFARPLPADTIRALVDNLDRERAPGEARELDFSPWGGAYNRVPAHATAFPHRDALFLLKHAVVVAPGQRRDWPARSWGLVHPWGTGGVYPNFPDPDLPAETRAYHGDNYERLLQVKAKYDPTGFFRHRD